MPRCAALDHPGFPFGNGGGGRRVGRRAAARGGGLRHGTAGRRGGAAGQRAGRVGRGGGAGVGRRRGGPRHEEIEQLP
jgi:hypothetical protein